MSLGAAMPATRAAEQDSPPTTITTTPELKIKAPAAEIDWHALDKSRFFILGAALFSGVSAFLYPIIVLKTRQHEGLRGFYRGFGTSLVGTIPARALYMAALEFTKSNVSYFTTVKMGLSETSGLAVANAVAGVSSAMAAQLVWTPVDVVSQRLMVQGCSAHVATSFRYKNGADAFKKILHADGMRGLYRGFGLSILTYAPCNAVWWSSYSVSRRVFTGFFAPDLGNGDGGGGFGEVAVQGLSATVASGVSAVVTMPLDTIKTRLQVSDSRVENKMVSSGSSRSAVVRTLKGLVREGGFRACYRGLGPRWASMAFSATTMVTTYEFLKKVSAKD